MKWKFKEPMDILVWKFWKNKPVKLQTALKDVSKYNSLYGDPETLTHPGLLLLTTMQNESK